MSSSVATPAARFIMVQSTGDPRPIVTRRRKKPPRPRARKEEVLRRLGETVTFLGYELETRESRPVREEMLDIVVEGGANGYRFRLELKARICSSGLLMLFRRPSAATAGTGTLPRSKSSRPRFIRSYQSRRSVGRRDAEKGVARFAQVMKDDALADAEAGPERKPTGSATASRPRKGQTLDGRHDVAQVSADCPAAELL